MIMSKALEAGKALIPGLLAKFPENLRASMEAAWNAPEAVEALTELGARALAQADYSRLQDQMTADRTKLQEQYDALTGWYETRQAALAEYDQIKPEWERLKATKPAPVVDLLKPTPAPVGMSKEDIEKILTEREQVRDEGYAGVLAISNALTVQHYKDFNEVLDLQGCIADARKNHVTLLDAYKTKYAEKIKAKSDAEENARIDKLVNERLAAQQKTDPNHFPLRNTSPSVLDLIETKGDTSKHTVDSAIALYDQLQSERGARA